MALNLKESFVTQIDEARETHDDRAFDVVNDIASYMPHVSAEHHKQFARQVSKAFKHEGNTLKDLDTLHAIHDQAAKASELGTRRTLIQKINRVGADHDKDIAMDIHFGIIDDLVGGDHKQLGRTCKEQHDHYQSIIDNK